MRTNWTSPALAAVFVLWTSVSGTAAPPELVASTEARSPEEERAAFRLPEGFVAELVGRLRFRLQWSWRIAATEVFAASLAFRHCSQHELGVLAGRLTARRARAGHVVADTGAVV